MWRDIGWLLKKEIQHQKNAAIWTLMFTVFIGLLTAIIFSGNFVEEGTTFFIVDMLFLIMLPSLATFYLASYYWDMGSVKKDPLSKKMALYRTLPITVSTISLSRMVNMLMILLVQSTIFYFIFLFTLYLLQPIFVQTHWLELIQFILFWFGYTLVVGGMLPVFEYSSSAKTLIVLSVCWGVVFILVELVFLLLIGGDVVTWIWLFIQQYGWFMVLFAHFSGWIFFYIWHRWLNHRLLIRDYV